MNTLDRFCNTLFIAVAIIIAAVIMSSVLLRQCAPEPMSKEQTAVDSLTHVNDSIKTSIKYIDSVKNEKINEVKSLDNDSTVGFFYKSIGKTRQ